VSHPNDVVWYLRVDHKTVQDVSVLTIEGRVSSLTVPELDRSLASAAAPPAAGLVLDLTGVDYINSAGLRVLGDVARAFAQAGRPFVVCGMKDAVTVAVGLAGLEGSLTTEESLDAALARATSSAPPAGETAC